MELIGLGVLLAVVILVVRRRRPRARRRSSEPAAPAAVDLTSMPSHLRDPDSGRVDRGWL